MRKEDFAEVLGDINENYIKEAETIKKTRKPAWIKWGAMAACLCLVIGSIMVSQNQNLVEAPGGGPDAGGNFSDGVDSLIYSVAVYPASEDAKDVEAATLKSISEADAYGFEVLGAYLPVQLPEGYCFGRANLYETTMKDGTKYYMLRVFYTSGGVQTSPTASEDGGEVVPDPNTQGDEFSVFVMNYPPNTDQKIYSPEEITESVLENIDGLTFHLRYGNIYVGISPETALPEDILFVINTITNS